jgi:hypothetical protein
MCWRGNEHHRESEREAYGVRPGSPALWIGRCRSRRLHEGLKRDSGAEAHALHVLARQFGNIGPPEVW